MWSFTLYEKPEPNRGLYLYHPGVKHATGITWLMSLSYDNLWNKPQLGQINKVFSFWNTFYPVRLTNSDAKAWSNWCCCIFTMMLIHEWTHPTNDPSCHFYFAYIFLWHTKIMAPFLVYNVCFKGWQRRIINYTHLSIQTVVVTSLSSFVCFSFIKLLVQLKQ